MFFELNQNLILCCQVATRITTFFIEHFGMRDLFGRENYEYYARLTGRILKVEDEWIFFTYPPFAYMSGGGSAEAINKTESDDSGDEAEAALDPMKIFSAPCFPCLLGKKYSANTNENRHEAKQAAFMIALMAIIFVLLS